VLHEAYGVALDATTMATRALDELALTAGTPSKVLAFARAATLVQVHQRGTQIEPDEGIYPFRLPGVSSWESRTFTGKAGPVERAIRGCGVCDPITLLRAAAIDNAASRLVTEAENATGVSDLSDTPESQRPAIWSTAQLAAQSFPRDQPARPSDQQPSRSKLGVPLSRASPRNSPRSGRPR